ncbi:MAG TPA: DNA repair protein RecO [Patescibacteria group bacterium]|nr:DNA repair protein RecO [Patescibacteria group bacterium]
MRESTKNISAIILKSDSYKEQDLLITIYSKEEGKLVLSARGARKSSSKLGGHLQIFNLANLMVVSGRSFDYIGAAKNNKSYLNVREDFNKLQIAGKAMYVFNRLVNTKVQDEDLYYLLMNFLDHLNQTQNNDISKLEMYYLSFLWQLLSILGYKPNLYTCYYCKKRVSEGVNHFNLDKASLACDHSQLTGPIIKLNSSIIKYLRFLNEYSFDKVELLKINKTDLKQLKNISNKYILYQLEEYLRKY